MIISPIRFRPTLTFHHYLREDCSVASELELMLTAAFPSFAEAPEFDAKAPARALHDEPFRCRGARSRAIIAARNFRFFAG